MRSGAPMRSRLLLALTALVLAAHVWLLQAPARHVHVASGPARPPAFTTRRIEAALPAPLAASVAVPLAPAPAPRRAGPLRVERVTAQARAASEHTSAPRPTAAAAGAESARFDVPPPAHMQYDVTAQVRHVHMQGRSDLTWEHDDRSYRATFELDMPGLAPRRQSSQGQLTAGGLEPLRFGEQLRGEQAAHFEREAGRVSFSNNRPAVPLLAGAQDRLSVLLQLAAALAGDPRRAAPGASISIQTATTREAEPWSFTVEGAQTLQLPAGEVTTVKLVRPPRGEYDQRMEVWLAPGKAYVPVRLRLTQPNGDWVDHQWSTTDRP
jgi:hypothetical protein